MTNIHEIKSQLRRVMIFQKYKAAAIRGAVDKNLVFSPPALLDTGLSSLNEGDHIIMHFANKQLRSIWPNEGYERFATHAYPTNATSDSSNLLKILCGTNAVSATANRINTCRFWLDFPSDPNIYAKSVLTLAVGMRDVPHDGCITDGMGKVLRYLLTGDFIHSVRDSRTEQALKAIGVTNVLNTACVTMWDLTPGFCKTIPTDKATDVLTTITDYGFDPEHDGYMLRTLKKHYRKVFLWVQGADDLSKLRTLPEAEGIELVEGGFLGLEQFVSEHDDFDYFGTRLHCGIYCLNHRVRSMIVTIDNRAADIQRDTNIPTVDRSHLERDMERLIEESRTTNITIPEDNIRVWKSQFAGRM